MSGLTVQPNEAAIDMASEELLTFPQASRRLPIVSGKEPMNPTTVWRWHRYGLRRADGVMVRLQAVRIGGRWVTSAQALERFLEALNATSGEAAQQPRSPHARSRAAERAGDELQRLGA
jgi:hypothetical protein